MFPLRDTLKAAGECFDGRKVEDLHCMPCCMTHRKVRMLYGTAQDEWDCDGVHQREARLLKFLFILIFILITPICSSCWHDLSPNHAQPSSWRVLLRTGQNTSMEEQKMKQSC